MINRYAGLPVYNADDARKVNEGAGRCWFKPDTLRFFSSRVSDRFYLNESNRVSYFVSSERNGYHNPRRYSVRVISWDTGAVDTVGTFQGYATSTSAHAKARKLSLASKVVAT